MLHTHEVTGSSPVVSTTFLGSSGFQGFSFSTAAPDPERDGRGLKPGIFYGKMGLNPVRRCPLRGFLQPRRLAQSNLFRGAAQQEREEFPCPDRRRSFKKGHEPDVPRRRDPQAAEHGLDRRAHGLRPGVGGEHLLLPRGGTTIMIDAGYNYDRLAEKMG